jgi:hypothetical protein
VNPSAHQRRFAILAVFVAVFTPVGVRAVRESEWIPSRTEAIALATVAAVLCLVGAVIAYRTTQAQVKLDLDEVQKAGKAH